MRSTKTMLLLIYMRASVCACWGGTLACVCVYMGVEVALDSFRFGNGFSQPGATHFGATSWPAGPSPHPPVSPSNTTAAPARGLEATTTTLSLPVAAGDPNSGHHAYVASILPIKTPPQARSCVFLV